MAGVMACKPTEKQPHWGDSFAGRSYKPRNREMAYETLINNYFNPNSMYTEEDFRRRPGFSPHQNVTIALRMLAYASPADAMDDTYGMYESTCLDNLTEFCHIVFQLYKEEYLLEPNQTDMDRLFCKAKGRDFSVPRSQNDIIVLGRSPLFNNLTEGKSPQLDYYINERQYNMGYYLAYDIYPKWATLVQAIANLENDA
ncbi:uncharacterized protein [Malus domestica]|uniref:uncharacterized protein n=1 Tax=Malus domestica TaxID=3750 RepID=UPI00397627C9